VFGVGFDGSSKGSKSLSLLPAAAATPDNAGDPRVSIPVLSKINLGNQSDTTLMWQGAETQAGVLRRSSTERPGAPRPAGCCPVQNRRHRLSMVKRASNGSLGDLFGRRLMFVVVGVAIFAVSSAGCGFASTIHPLIIARSIQGVRPHSLRPAASRRERALRR